MPGLSSVLRQCREWGYALITSCLRQVPDDGIVPGQGTVRGKLRPRGNKPGLSERSVLLH
jgi:hypothetical protein